MIDKEKLRPAFEAWYESKYEVSPGPCTSDGWYVDLGADGQWDAWCAAFESLGEPVAYSLDDEIGREYSDEDYFPGGRRGGTPLYRLPEVKG